MEAEIYLYNKTKGLYLYIQDNQSDDDCDTEYTVYDLYGNDQDGGLISASSCLLDTDAEIIEWIIIDLGWTENELFILSEKDAEQFETLVRDWEQQKIDNAKKFVGFNMERGPKWEKR